ncbi:hypothetical protein MRX96_039457 [Rhipicephalus microplus]
MKFPPAYYIMVADGKELPGGKGAKGLRDATGERREAKHVRGRVATPGAHRARRSPNTCRDRHYRESSAFGPSVTVLTVLRRIWCAHGETRRMRAKKGGEEYLAVTPQPNRPAPFWRNNNTPAISPQT